MGAQPRSGRGVAGELCRRNGGGIAAEQRGERCAWRDVEKREGAPVVARVHNTMLQLTPYSAIPRLTTKLQEWRIYEAMPGKLPDLHNRFANHTLRLFEKHGVTNIGYWTEVFGTSNRLVYMLGYPDTEFHPYGFPSQQLMTDLFSSLGVVQSEFFLGQGRWSGIPQVSGNSGC